jgi:non-heme chloroperoxidase
MQSLMVTGSRGTQLHVIHAGNSRGPPIVFIHGFCQSALAWTRQLNSRLTEKYRLVAVDLRGHGLSDKPREGYADSRSWADDLQAVIQALDLDHPILCGWSYGPLVILDYLRHYGEGNVRGVNFIGGVTKLGSDDATSVLTDDFTSLVPGFLSADADESVRSLSALLRLCFAEKLSDEDRYRMLGYNVSVPVYVRQALFSRTLDNDDLLSKLQRPVLITHGAADAVVKPVVIDQQMARINSARIRMMATGLACFWDDAVSYNGYLQEFADAL